MKNIIKNIYEIMSSPIITIAFIVFNDITSLNIFYAMGLISAALFIIKIIKCFDIDKSIIIDYESQNSEAHE